MLKHLSIENIALIDHLKLDFEKGMSVITGETGAGKSVVINALALLLGGRADKDSIRFGSNTGRVKAIFDCSKFSAENKTRLKSYTNNNMLEISREIPKTGRSKIMVNSTIISLTQLKELTAPLMEILGQHANQKLMNEDNHLEFLDIFSDISELKNETASLFYQWKTASDELKRFKEKRDFLINENDLLVFQKDEIEKAEIKPGEEEQLIVEKKKLDSARSLMASANLLNDIFESEEQSLSGLLALAQKELEKMSEADPDLQKTNEELIDLTFRFNDLKDNIEQYGASIVDDPNRIEEINYRLDELFKLKKKYGGSEESILSSLVKIKQRLSDQPPNIDKHIEQLELECQKYFESYSKTALSLSEIRQQASVYLSKIVIKELKELSIDNSRFEFEFLYENDPNGVKLDNRFVKPTANGLESGRILFSANPGEPLKSLVKTASGGEVSRVLLALKSAEKKNKKRNQSLMVFDEVDAGIGGQTALEVARKLKKLSGGGQLLVITHLHQIAREADHHYVVKKTNDLQKRVIIKVNKLDGKTKDNELKRMVALPE